MGSEAAEDHAEETRALARDLRGAVQRGLEHENPLVVARGFEEQRVRGLGADLFVRHQEHRDPRRSRIEREGTKHRHPHRDTRLHVENPGPAREVAVDAEG